MVKSPGATVRENRIPFSVTCFFLLNSSSTQTSNHLNYSGEFSQVIERQMNENSRCDLQLWRDRSRKSKCLWFTKKTTQKSDSIAVKGSLDENVISNTSGTLTGLSQVLLIHASYNFCWQYSAQNKYKW